MKYILFLCAFLVNFLSFAATIAAGSNHSLFVDTEGYVWAVGKNWDGQLGLGMDYCDIKTLDDGDVKTLTKIERLPPIKTVAAGDEHSLLLDTEGNVWATGDNLFCQLGLGDNVNRNIPTKIEGMPLIKAVAAGRYHSLFLDTEGNVWATGGNYNGELGLGDSLKKRDRPVRIEGMPLIKAIAAGSLHSLFLDTEGNVWATGGNFNGQLGLGDNVNRTVPTKIEVLPLIKAITAGNLYTLFLDNEGHVWAAGVNNYGQLGLGDTENRKVPNKIEKLSRIMALTACGYQSLFLDVDGNVWAVGKNDGGPLGLGDNVYQVLVPTKIEGIPTIKAVATEHSHSLFLDTEGHVWATGYNGHGQLGLGDNVYKVLVPTKIEGLPPIQVPMLEAKIPTKSARKI